MIEIKPRRAHYSSLGKYMPDTDTPAAANTGHRHSLTHIIVDSNKYRGLMSKKSVRKAKYRITKLLSRFNMTKHKLLKLYPRHESLRVIDSAYDDVYVPIRIIKRLSKQLSAARTAVYRSISALRLHFSGRISTNAIANRLWLRQSNARYIIHAFNKHGAIAHHDSLLVLEHIIELMIDVSHSIKDKIQ